jgi:hypothetical protein
MPCNAEQARKHAHDCQNQAAMTKSQTRKEFFEQLTDTWLRIADDIDQLKVLRDAARN